MKSILGFLQEDVPGAPVDAQEMDAIEQPPGEPLPTDMEGEHETETMPGPPAPPMLDIEDDLVRKRRKRRASMGSSADAFEAAMASKPQQVTGGY